jgi:diguanylate cyclase (GGDEF)-like protein
VPVQTGGVEKTAGTGIRVTVSLGVSSLLSKTDTFNEIIARADHALYTAKESGRNRVCIIPGNA